MKVPEWYSRSWLYLLSEIQRRGSHWVQRCIRKPIHIDINGVPVTKHAVRLTTGTLVINIIYFVLLDRLMMAAVQRRTGPYNVGYFGLLQPMDDGLKLVKNEVIIPKKSSCILFLVVPNLFFYCSLILWSIIPLEGFCYNMDFTFNIFLQLFISNVQVVTNMSSGVTSNSKYTTYGSLRIGGQILS